MSGLYQVFVFLVPPPRISSGEWLEKNVTMPKGTETAGMPFSMAAFVDGK